VAGGRGYTIGGEGESVVGQRPLGFLLRMKTSTKEARRRKWGMGDEAWKKKAGVMRGVWECLFGS